MRAFEKCQRLLIEKGGCSVNETQGSVSGLVTHVLGDLDLAEVWGAELIYARHWVMLCPFVLGKPCLSTQQRDHAIHLGTPGSNEAVAGSCVGLQLRDRTERVAERQHWWLAHSALWIMVPRETCLNSTIWSNSQASLSWGWGSGSLILSSVCCAQKSWTWH